MTCDTEIEIHKFQKKIWKKTFGEWITFTPKAMLVFPKEGPTDLVWRQNEYKTKKKMLVLTDDPIKQQALNQLILV